MKKFNDWLAVKITSGVATMWCAYFFGALALYGGTGVHWNDPLQIIQWVSQTFLQLVLLSIIMVGQRVVSEAADQQAKEMHDTVMQSHAELQELVRETHERLANLEKRIPT